MRLAILARDTAVRAAIAGRMKASGRACLVFDTPEALRRALRRETFDLLIIDGDPALITDAHLPTASRRAMEFAQILQFTSQPAAIPATGPDGILVLPAQFDQLDARVAALVAPFGKDGSAVETHGPLRFDLATMTVNVRDRHVDLTAKEFGLALLMVRNAGRPLSRSHIMENVWGRVPDVASRTLDAHVSQIRKRLDLRPSAGFRLSSVYGFGYVLEKIDP